MTSKAGDRAENGGNRACDQCRTRKVRCDKKLPCANCRIAQRTCSSTGMVQKPKEARQRILISAQYERKFDHFADRLNGIEHLLQELATSLHSRGTHQPIVPSSFTSPATGDASSTACEGEELDTAFKGDSSLAAHTVFASKFLERAVKPTPQHQPDLDMQSALSALQQIVGMQNRRSASSEVRFPNQKPLPTGGFRELPMPPMHLVVHVLQEIKEVPSVTFTITCCFVSVGHFTECCRKVYFAIEDFTVATFVIVSSGLYHLFDEKSLAEKDPAIKAEYLKYRTMCGNNLETALGTLNLFMSATRENIEALLLGASYAIEVSRPSLAWQMNCTAAQMCQTLGYHRLPPFSDVQGADFDHETKSTLFWFAYMLDKGLALRLSRASVIQDYDTAFPTYFGEAHSPLSSRRFFGVWIRHAEVQGKIYEQLYSSGALSVSSEQRIQCAWALADEIKAMARDTETMKEEFVRATCPREYNVEGLDSLEMTFRSEMVSFHSTLTLIYRAIPPMPGASNTFNPECIESAREAFRYHMECMRLVESSVGAQNAYLHWTILFAPFVPLIVIFCHVIEISDADDLQRLSDFIASLQPVCAISEAIEQLHRLTVVLHNIAALYIKAKSGQAKDEDMPTVGNDFDLYLSQLGFMPLAGEQTAFNSAVLQHDDWVAGNWSVLGLLEEDLSSLHA